MVILFSVLSRKARTCCQTSGRLSRGGSWSRTWGYHQGSPRCWSEARHCCREGQEVHPLPRGVYLVVLARWGLVFVDVSWTIQPSNSSGRNGWSRNFNYFFTFFLDGVFTNNLFSTSCHKLLQARKEVRYLLCTRRASSHVGAL